MRSKLLVRQSNHSFHTCEQVSNAHLNVNQTSVLKTMIIVGLPRRAFLLVKVLATLVQREPAREARISQANQFLRVENIATHKPYAGSDYLLPVWRESHVEERSARAGIHQQLLARRYIPYSDGGRALTHIFGTIITG